MDTSTLKQGTSVASAQVATFFDETTFTATHVVIDRGTQRCAIIDPVLDFDAKSGRIRRDHADEIIAFVQREGLLLDWILETHAHADHLSAAPTLQSALGGRIGIGEHIRTVQATFKSLFNAGAEFLADGSQFDHLFTDGESFAIGALAVRVVHTPGHTPACVTYVAGDAAFVGDTLFMPDFGTARTDFPGGDARTLYRSIRKILALSPETRLFLCHDYKVPGRDDYRWLTSVAAQKALNIHVRDGIDEAQFAQMREARDRTLDMPQLLLPAIQVNMRAGHLPPPEDNGVRYLKLPINAL